MKLDPQSTLESLSGRQFEQLRAYVSLLVRVAIPRGYVSVADGARLWERHIADSLRALSCLEPRPITAVDVGSGAGLPGIPLAITRSDCRLELVEPKARRAGFLELVAEELSLTNVRVINKEVEQSGVMGEVAVARALAPPRRAWEMCQPALTPKGFLLYFAGKSWTPLGAASVAELGVACEICVDPQFPWQGPIVKMVRQLTPSA